MLLLSFLACFLRRLFLDESPTRSVVSRSRSIEGLRKISQTSAESVLTLEQELREQEYMWQRTHSLSDTQKVLDDAIRDLEEYIAGDLASAHVELNLQRRYSSNDSAMGGSEAVVSPLQLDSTYSEPSTLNRKRQVHDSVDSAFSNYSSPTNSSEGMHHMDVLSLESDIAVSYNHIRMSSEASNTSAASPVPRQESPELSDKLPPLTKVDTSSLPSPNNSETAMNETAPMTSSTLPSQLKQEKSSLTTLKYSKNSKHKGQTLFNSSVSSTGTYSHHRSPILSSKDHHLYHSETQLDDISSDHTPTDSTHNITSSPSGFSLDSSHLKGTII